MTDSLHPADRFSQLVASGLDGSDLVAKFEASAPGGFEAIASVAIAKVLELESHLQAATSSRARALPVYDPEDVAVRERRPRHGRRSVLQRDEDRVRSLLYGSSSRNVLPFRSRSQGGDAA